jgi:SAM-dependent methyltransferase
MSVGEPLWGHGYVTDIAYLPGYYRSQSPLHLNLACLLGGVAGVEITAGSPVSYLELGCGQGFGALVLAASNPAWRVTGIDFNPAHIAGARNLARIAGIDNAVFVEADLSTLAETALATEVPDAEIVSLHGLWSWVSEHTRAGIVALLATKLRPGGIAHLSYNALPAWQGAIGMQRLLREVGERQATRSDRQAEAGLGIVRELYEAKVAQLSGNSFVDGLLQHAERTPLSYRAHEYINAVWQPCFHADVVAALRPAKLEWVASANLLENFRPLMLDDPSRKIVDRFDDPIVVELIKDMCLRRGLRQDVFVRGARRLSEAERNARLGDVTLGLTCGETDFVWELDVPAGRASIERPFFGPIVAALAEGPRRVRDLLELPALPRRDNPGELVGVLVGSEQALPLLAPPDMVSGPAARLNTAAAALFARPDNLSSVMALATSGSGAPVPCSMLELAVADRLSESMPAEDLAALLFAGASQEGLQALAQQIERIRTKRVGTWRSLGALPAE